MKTCRHFHLSIRTDSRAVAYDFAKERASVAIVYYNEKADAMETAGRIEALGGSIQTEELLWVPDYFCIDFFESIFQTKRG